MISLAHSRKVEMGTDTSYHQSVWRPGGHSHTIEKYKSWNRVPKVNRDIRPNIGPTGATYR